MTAPPALARKNTGGRWTDAARARYAEMARERELWKHSTGPRTPAGKRIVAQNARKAGALAWNEQRLTRAYLRSIAALLDRA